MAGDGRRTAAQRRCAAMAGDEPAPVCPRPNHLPLSMQEREREDHHGGVGFAGEFAVGELAPVDHHPLSQFD